MYKKCNCSGPEQLLKNERGEHILARSKKIVKYKKPLNVNIGLVIFLVIIVYIVFNIFQYVTSESIAAYEVTQGSIAANNTHRGLIIRSESVAYADRSGYINYYMKSGSRVSVNDVIYSIDTKGDISEQIRQASSGDNTLSMDSIKEISSDIDTFTASYQSSNFSAATNFKDNISSTLLQMVNNTALDALGDKVTSASSNNTFFLMKPKDTGVIAYYIDGYEGISADDFSASMMDASSYARTNLNVNEKVSASDPVYKLITDEAWNIVIEISEEQAETLSEGSSVKIRFCEDDFTTTAKYSILQDSGRFFLNLKLQTAMVRYINERFIDIELVVNEESGLKIPKSAITTKQFFTVPKEAFTLGGDSEDYGLMISSVTDDGETITFVQPTIYYETEDYYYIDDEDVSLGDVVIYNNSSKKYTIGTDVDSLSGVYNINKGYAVFKQINVMYENEDYVIVEQKTSYGVALYDHIALDGSKLTENQLVTK
jgi:hypothetical protein